MLNNIFFAFASLSIYLLSVYRHFHWVIDRGNDKVA